MQAAEPMMELEKDTSLSRKSVLDCLMSLIRVLQECWKEAVSLLPPVAARCDVLPAEKIMIL